MASRAARSEPRPRANSLDELSNGVPADFDYPAHISSLYGTPEVDGGPVDQGHLASLLEQPRYVKVFRKSKTSAKMFQRMFLAQELKPQQGEASAIWVTKFSKDGKYMACGRQDGVVLIWKVISSPLGRMESQSSAASRNRSASTSSAASKADSSALSVSTYGGHDVGPDRTMLVCPELSYTLNNKVFAPVFEDKPFRELRAHTNGVVSLDWSRNNFLITGSMDNTVRLWHVDRASELQCFQHDEFVTSVNFHPSDDRFFLSGCMDSQLRLWSILDGEVSFQKEMPGLITAATFTPDGETCVAGGLGWCSVLETRGLDKKYDFHIKGPGGPADAVGPKITGIEAYDDHSEGAVVVTKVVITSNDSRMRKFNLSTKAVETKFKGAANDHSQVVGRLNENGTFLISGSENHWCYIWDFTAEGKVSNAERAKETFKKMFHAGTPKPQRDHAPQDAPRYSTHKNSEYLVFHAHHNEVTTAVFAPVATSKLVELSNDPLYELYSNYQVYVSSSARADDAPAPSMSRKDSSGSVSSIAALHRNTADDMAHPESSLIVTTDKSGVIRIFRRDFVYNIRKALRHDLYNRYKGKRPSEMSDVSSLLSATKTRSSARAVSLERAPLYQKKLPDLSPGSFVPLGLGGVGNDLEGSSLQQESDEYSLSSDSSVVASNTRSHTAKERPMSHELDEAPSLADSGVSRGRNRTTSQVG